MEGTCWICARADLRPAAGLADLGFAACADCGFVFRPEVATDDLREVYEGGEYEDRDFSSAYTSDDDAVARDRSARAQLAWVRRHATSGRLLDVGAAGGAFVAAAGRAGFTASGLEPAPGFAAYARETVGVDVRHGRLEDAELEPGAYDVITLWHVLEHIPRPVEVLSRLRAALAPAGVLIVEVPNRASVMAERLDRRWVGLQPEVHVSQFAPGTLAAAFERAGLRLAELTTLAHGESLTWLERIHPRHLAHRGQLALAGAPRAAHPGRHELLRAAAGPA